MARRIQDGTTEKAPGESPHAGFPEEGEAGLKCTFTHLVFDAQYRNLERATGTAQALLSAVTLSAALATPLLLIGVRRSALDGYSGFSSS
jgi:hypothetical protein